MSRPRTLPAATPVPAHNGRQTMGITMTEAAIHTVQLQEGHFACIVLSRPGSDNSAVAYLDADEEEAVFTDDGQFTAGFRAMIGAPEPQGCTCQQWPTHCANDCPEHGLVEA